MLIGISGYIGSGKDEVASMIQFFTTVSPSKRDIGAYQGDTWKIHGARWQNRKFAAKLKQIVSLLTGIPVADLEKESVKSSKLGPEWNTRYSDTYPATCPMTVRTLLQRVGTEAMRNQVHEDIWVNALFANYKPISSEQYCTGIEDSGVKEIGYEPVWPNWVISDCRFENEAKAIKDRGGIVIRINRLHENRLSSPGVVYSASVHPSEISLDNWQFDYTIENSGTLEELLEQVRIMLLHFKIIT